MSGENWIKLVLQRVMIHLQQVSTFLKKLGKTKQKLRKAEGFFKTSF